MMRDTANRSCRILFDVLIGQGLEYAVLSPGSRNAPLLIAAAARPNLKKHIVPDERTAAFMALGMATSSRRPVLLACTSGTAMYNYAPAVAEAMYRHVPLIIVTADRPQRWIDQDDSQTLRQQGALDNIVKRSFNISATEGATVPTRGPRFNTEQDWYTNRLANEAWITATSGRPGPVHINIQIDNPLGETVEREDIKAERIVDVVKSPGTLSPDGFKNWALRLAGRNVLVVAGFMNPDNDLNKALKEFVRLPNVAVCAEPLANLHLHPERNCCEPSDAIIDTLLARSDKATKMSLRPDVVISIGGSLVSRMLKEFIREYQPEECWTLGDTDPGVDCFQCLTAHFEMDPAAFFHGMASISKWLIRRGEYPADDHLPSYSEKWACARKKALSSANGIIENMPWSELSASTIILNNLPKKCNLFLSNGTPIRYVGLGLVDTPFSCYCNRGVSGIEGGSATAAGLAMKQSVPTILYTGDMSFSYNPQILGLPGLPDNFKIIVVNNSGGGIFRFIGQTRDLPEREEYFCADRPQPIEGLAKAYGWEYMQASNASELNNALPLFLSGSRKILEIIVDPEISARVLTKFLQN